MSNKLVRSCAAMLFVIGAHSALGAATATPASCDAACLTALADQYLSALAARDPSGLPVSPAIEAAENSHRVALGENLWRVVVKVREPRQYFTDADSGQVLAIGVLELSAAEPFIYALRLKIDDHRISEAEMMVSSDKIAGQHFKPDRITPFDTLYSSAVPAAQRASREDLLGIAAAVWQDEGKGVRFASDCVHSENADRLPQYRCSAAPRGGMFTAQRAIRHPLVDVEHGVVVTYALQDAVPRPRTPPAGEKTPIFYQRPVTFYAMQLLKVVNGQIEGESLFANIQEANAPSPFAPPLPAAAAAR